MSPLSPAATGGLRKGDARIGGFSLVELSVVLAVVGVLATLAWPSFLEQLARSRRPDAYLTLERLHGAQQAYRQRHGGYAQDLQQLTGAGAAHSAGGHYRLALQGHGPDGYELSALAEASQQRDRECPALTLQVRGEITQRQPGGRCWGA